MVKDVSESNMCIVYGLSQFKRSDEVKVGNTEPGNLFRREAVAVQVPTRRIVPSNERLTLGLRSYFQHARACSPASNVGLEGCK